MDPALINRTAARQQTDRYYKHFKTYDHLVTMLFVALSGVTSLRELTTVILACEGKINHLNMQYFPRRSTISDSTTISLFSDILKALELPEGSFVVFDKGYTDYGQYYRWSQQQVSFVTRQKDNAVYESVAENELDESIDPTVLKDEQNQPDPRGGCVHPAPHCLLSHQPGS